MTGIPIRGKATGTAARAYEIAVRRGAQRREFTKAYFVALYAVCEPLVVDADVLVAQWDLETRSGTSGYWIDDGNPAGIAAFDDGSNWGLTFTPEQAAGAQAAHMARYLGIAVPDALRRLDARWDAVAEKGYVGTVTTTDDLGNGRWATDAGYARKLRERYEAYWGTYATGETAVTTFTKHTFPGLPNPVYLPSWIAVEIKLIPSTVNGWTSGQYVAPSNFTSTTYHDTGNDASSATSEYNWAATGGRGAINSPGSYNGIFDGTKLIITQRFDELVGHAANPTGNVTSYAFEEAYGAHGHDKALEVGMWVHAGVLQSMGKTAAKSMYLHQFWSGKWCSKQILDRKQWGYVEKTVDARIGEIKSFLANGGTTTPTPIPTYKTPVAVPELAAFIRNGAIVSLPTGPVKAASGVVWHPTGYDVVMIEKGPRLAGDRLDSGSRGEDIPKGHEFRTIAWGVGTDGAVLYLTPGLTRVDARKVRIADAGMLKAA